MRPQMLAIVVLIGLIAFVGCGDLKTQPSRAPGTVGGTSADPVQYVSAKDSDMNTAITKARETVDKFLVVLAKPAPNQKGFSVKKVYDSSNGGEHIWIVDIKFTGTEFVGKVGNDPDNVPGLKFGDPARVGTREITDWMYIEDGAIVGAYTLRVLMKHAKGAEAEEMKKFKFKEN